MPRSLSIALVLLVAAAAPASMSAQSDEYFGPKLLAAVNAERGADELRRWRWSLDLAGRAEGVLGQAQQAGCEVRVTAPAGSGYLSGHSNREFTVERLTALLTNRDNFARNYGAIRNLGCALDRCEDRHRWLCFYDSVDVTRPVENRESVVIRSEDLAPGAQGERVMVEPPTDSVASTSSGQEGAGNVGVSHGPDRLIVFGSDAASSAMGQRFLDAHNRVRVPMTLPPLTWDPALAASAQDWADTLSTIGCRMRHKPNNPHGENIFFNSGYDAVPDEVVAAWASEKENYDYRTNKCTGMCGHYTQVVWANSRRLGCGVASCGPAQVWVCHYDPPGNVVGYRPF